MTAIYIFELKGIQGNINDAPIRAKIEEIGERTWASHEDAVPKDVRTLITVKRRIDEVSFFILDAWETYAIGKDVPICIKKLNKLIESVRAKFENTKITHKEITAEYSENQGIITYLLPYLTWFLGSYIGKIGDLNYWIIITFIYLILATIIEGRERVYSWALSKYYDP